MKKLLLFVVTIMLLRLEVSGTTWSRKLSKLK